MRPPRLARSLHPLHDLAGLIAAFPGLQPARRLRHPEEQRYRDQDVQRGQDPQVLLVLAGEHVVRDDAGQDDQEQEDADGLADHHDPGPDLRPHDLAHVDDVDGQEPGEPERVGDRENEQRPVVRHVGERPDEHPGQRRGQDQGRAPADLVGQPAQRVAADQDADPGLQGVQDVVLGVGDDLGWQPDERVQPGGDPVGGCRGGPPHLHDQADFPGHKAHRQTVDPGCHLAGNDQSAAGGGSRGILCHWGSPCCHPASGWRVKRGIMVPLLPMPRVPGSQLAMLVIKRWPSTVLVQAKI